MAETTNSGNKPDYINGVAVDNSPANAAPNGNAKQYSASALKNQNDKAGLSTGFDGKNTNKAAKDELAGLGLDGSNPAAAFNPFSNLPASRLARLKKIFFGNKGRTTASITTLAGGIIAGGFASFMLVAPLAKVNSVLDVAERTFLSSSKQIGDNIAERMLTQYISTKLIPGMVTNNCQSTKIDRTCANVSSSDKYTGKIMNAYRDTRVEKKLYDNHKIEISREGNKFYLSSPELDSPELLGDAPTDANGQTKLDEAVRKALTRGQIRTAVRNELSGWRNMMIRYQTASLMERKYGVSRCVVACGSRDKASAWVKNNPVADRTKAGKAALLSQIVSSKYGSAVALAVECASDPNFSCIDTTGEEPEPDGTRQSKYSKELRARVAAARVEFGDEKLSEILKQSDEIRNRGGLSAYIMNNVLEKLLGKTIGAITGKALPLVGWVDTAVVTQAGAASASTLYTHAAYATNATMAVATLGLFAAANDEFKASDMDPATFGSISSMLDASDDTENGGGGAETSPVFQTFTGKEVDKNYSCKDGGDMGGNELVCKTDESLLGAQNTGTDLLAAYGINQAFVGEMPILNGMKMNDFSAAWRSTITVGLSWIGEIVANAASSAVGAAIKAVTGFDLNEWVAGVVANGVNFMMEMIVPPMVTVLSSGARITNAIFTGMAVLARDTAVSWGGGQISAEQFAENTQQLVLQQQAEFDAQPVAQRLFDTEETRSLVSQAAMATPTTLSGLTSSITNFFGSPQSAIASSLSNITSGQSYAATASAATYQQYYEESGVDFMYGYEPDDPLMTTTSFEQYEEERDCTNPDAQIYKDWDASGGYNNVTGEYIYTTTNGCMALKNMACNLAGEQDPTLCETPGGAAATDESATPAPGGNLTKARGEQLGKEYTTACMSGASYPGDICGFLLNQCVSFIKYIMMEYNTKYEDSRFASMGNGADVVSGLGSNFGYVVNSTPAPLSVVSFPRGWDMGDWNANVAYGHTALVLAVNSDGSLLIVQASSETGPYVSTLPAANAQGLRFAHTEADIAGAAQ